MVFGLRRRVALLACLLAAVTLSRAAFADDSHDRTQVGHNINISPDEPVSEATCFGCSIRVRGHVSGDVTTFGGSIILEDDAQIDGDATTFGGEIRMDRQVKVDGDVTVFGGRIRRDPSARVGGDVTNMGGGWILLIFATPFLLFGLFVWFVVWLVRRLTQPAVPAAV